MGSNVIYFGIHEYGFDGQVHVSSFTRHVSPSQFGKAIPKSARKSKAKRRAALGTEAVRAHTRWMSMPARAPLGHGIADHVGDFTASIDSALRATWKGVQP